MGSNGTWEKLGCILRPMPEIYWMATYTGPSFAYPLNDRGLFRLYVTGRDKNNRSLIGTVKIDLDSPTKPLSISERPVFDVGELGTFDENGVSYPSIVEVDGALYMYYAGWMPTVLTPFQNRTGLAVSNDGGHSFSRVSRAPILPLTDQEPFSTGSVCTIKEGDRWKMWYTCFLRWGKEPGEHKHYYVIKYAESGNGIEWNRDGQICIDIDDPSEYAIGKPSVIRHAGHYHMWYVYRGEEYRIGYAVSENGINWQRRDDLAGIDVSETGWDSRAISYPHVFRSGNCLYMLYCGNNYGKEGLGLARLRL